MMSERLFQVKLSGHKGKELHTPTNVQPLKYSKHTKTEDPAVDLGNG